MTSTIAKRQSSSIISSEEFSPVRQKLSAEDEAFGFSVS